MPAQLQEAPVAPIDAAEKRLQDVFNDDFAFEIPSYQRPYAWEIEQVDQLLSDLLDAMEAPASATGGVYFLGSVVLIKERNLAKARVIDGQQRLTTLTILFSVLRDLTSDLESKLERDGHVKQKGSKDKGTEDRMRLSLRESDQSFFREKVQHRDATTTLKPNSQLEGSQLRIVENTIRVRTRLQALDELRRDELMRFILTRCYLVVVSVPTQETARRIFTVLNARGLDLTPTDILKAQLLDRVKVTTAEKELAARWEASENALGRDSFVELFKIIRMIDEQEKPREALESAFPKKVKSFQGDPAAFVGKVLEPYADAYSTLLDEREMGAAFGADIRTSVAALHRLDNTDWHPSALAYMVHFGEHKGLAESAPGFFGQLERLSYSLFLTRADINIRIKRHADIIKDILRASSPNQRIASIDLSASEREATIDAIEGPLYKKARVCKPLLLRLDELLSNGSARYSGTVTVEHVLPQNVAAGSEWEKHFPREVDRLDWTHRLANLVLLNRSSNAAASNWDFDKKKTQYFLRRDGRNPFPLTQEVLDENSWTLEVLQRRQARLVNVLSDHWVLT